MPNRTELRPQNRCERTYAMLLAGGRGKRLGPLTDRRAKPAVPFAGKLKIIDFALSNCVSSGIHHIGVLTQYKAQSLIRHIERGWGFLSATLVEFVDVVPAQQQQGEAWYAGTADAVAQNADLIRESRARWVFVLARDAADAASAHDFGHDIVPALVQRGQAWAHRFERSCVNTGPQGPCWRDVGTVDAYYAANMDLIEVVPQLNLYDDAWSILSQQRQLPPAKFVFDDGVRCGQALQSLVASGCIVSGAVVRRSILFSKVRVEEGSRIDDSLLLPNAACGRGVVLRRCIVDKHCRLPDGFVAGLDPAFDRERGFHVTPGGVTLVTPEMIGQAGRVG